MILLSLDAIPLIVGKFVQAGSGAVVNVRTSNSSYTPHISGKANKTSIQSQSTQTRVTGRSNNVHVRGNNNTTRI